MWPLLRARLRDGPFWLVTFTVLLGTGALIYVASGIYNVAASKPHLGITDAFIKFALHRSVATHSSGVEIPELDRQDLVTLGREHFELGCAPCHGPIGGTNNPIVRRMYPAPPPLDSAARDWDTAELFWLVRHGLKFTGMPAWAGEGRDDEVWAVVAYLQEVARQPAPSGPASAATAPPVAFGQEAAAASAGCVACHGDALRPPVSGRVPPLQGQTMQYLQRAMREYREGWRESGIMEPIAAGMDDRAIAVSLQGYVQAARVPTATAEPANADAIARGEAIARAGMPAANLPACLTCHSGSASPDHPRLNRLPAAYVEAQLALFSSGVRSRTPQAQIMSTIARRLTPEQMEEVAAYFEQAPAEGLPSAAAAEPVR